MRFGARPGRAVVGRPFGGASLRRRSTGCVLLATLLRPCRGRQVQETADVTLGGVILPETAKARPLSGEVVRVGPGKQQEDGSRKALRVQPGDRVVYFKYAGARAGGGAFFV